jgi:tetratricopeptide (TPR) repeat protein
VEAGNLDEGIRTLEAALEANPGYTEARKYLALAYHRRGDAQRAEALLNETIELHQDYPDLHKILGDVRLAMGRLESAKEAYRQSLALNPHYSDAVCSYVIALRRDGNGRQADEILGAYIERHPADLLARTLLTVEKMKLPDA